MGTLELIVYAYPDEETAKEALQRLKEMNKEGEIDIINAAVIVKDEKGKIHTKETADPGAKEGALFGALVGGLLGLVAGPAGVVLGALAGAGTGGIAADKIDMGIQDDELKELGTALDAGSSAIIAVIEHRYLEEIRNTIERESNLVLEKSIRDEIASQLSDQSSQLE